MLLGPNMPANMGTSRTLLPATPSRPSAPSALRRRLPHRGPDDGGSGRPDQEHPGRGAATPPPRRHSLRWQASAIFAVVGTFLAGGLVASGLFLHIAADERALLLQRLGPSLAELQAYQSDLVGASVGAREYFLDGDPRALALYRSDLRDSRRASRALRAELPGGDLSGDDLGRTEAAARTWERTLRAEVSPHPPAGLAVLARGTTQLARVRTDLASVLDDVDSRRRAAVAAFDRSLLVLEIVVAAVFAAAIALLVALRAGVRRGVLTPLTTVGSDARRVTDGALEHPVRPAGPAEVAELADAIDEMRRRVVHDLRELEQAHADLAARSEELARSNRDLAQFAAAASHDLQEPLRKVAAFCQLLEERYSAQLDDRGRQYVAFAADGAKRMQALVRDLLHFSLVGGSRHEWSVVDLDACLREAETNLGTRLEDSGARVVRCTPLPAVPGNGPLLVALWQNLVDNAVKFRSDEPPVVEVAATRDGDGWRLEVADNGIGIDAAHSERIFDVFTRLHTRERYEGTGIGLAMCRRIVELHGGSIGVQAGREHGTTIRFTLPAERAGGTSSAG